MKIYLIPNTVGRYGGALNGNLRYFYRFIQDELKNSEFKSSFDELLLTLSYPPMYILPGIIGMELTFNDNYATFPYSRLNRRYKRIEIILRAPEFSEHFDNEQQKKYKNKFEIETQFQDISEVQLGQILIDKFIEAGEIINSKIKKDDVFDFDNFNKVLLSIKKKINSDFLEEMNKAQNLEVEDNTLNKANQLRSERQKIDWPKDRLIRDLRIYYSGLPNKALYPYDKIYAEIFLNLLAREGLMCPKYHHLYIQVAETMDEALKNSFSFEDWYVNGLAVINYKKYLTLTEKEKEYEVFQTILSGLKDIAIIDKLDINIIDKVANRIVENGMDTELFFNTVENSNYKLVITYFSRSIEDECPVFFNLTDKTKNITKRHQIGKANNLQLFLWLQKITLNNKKIKIKSSNSIQGQICLKDKPTLLEFDIAELMK
ncbi:MAG: hypothetical protein IPP53_16035 [Bacteroidetes bacterium]|nr:hypothetical protein [Bacteroidota bacterium]